MRMRRGEWECGVHGGERWRWSEGDGSCGERKTVGMR